MNIQFIKVISATILLILVTACNSESQQTATSDNNVITGDNTVVTESETPQKPAEKTATMLVEGEETSVNMKLYEEPKLFSTYFPKEDFLVEETNSNQQKEVKFTVNFGGVKNEDAYIKFIFPNQFQSLAEIKDFINSDNGVIAANKWKVISSSSNVKYPWAKEKISFSKGQNIVGDIYIGEQNGKLFYVVTHLPIEYADGFAAREDLIFKNLEIGNYS